MADFADRNMFGFNSYIHGFNFDMGLDLQDSKGPRDHIRIFTFSISLALFLRLRSGFT